MGYDYGEDGLIRNPKTILVETLSKGGDEAKKLLEDGFDIDTVDRGYTALQKAAMYENSEAVDFLLDRGASINRVSSDEPVSSALHFAVRKSREDIVKLLLERGAIIDKEDLENGSLLNMALLSGDKKAFQDVLDYYGPEVDYYEAISKIEDGSNASIVKRFLENDCTDHNQQFTLYSVAKDGYMRIAKLFLHPKTSDECQDWTSIQASICQKENKIIKGLLFKPQRHDPIIIDLMSEMSKDQIKTVLLNAIEMKNREVVAFLREQTILNESSYKAILMSAIKTHDEQYLKWVLDLNFALTVDFKFEYVMEGDWSDNPFHQFLIKSPLYRAVEKGDFNLIELLLANCPDVDVVKSSQVDALLYATKKNQEAIVKLLLERGADINGKKRSTGKTALLVAIEEGHDNIVKLLLDKGASIKDIDKNGETALHFAAKRNRDNVVKLLLQIPSTVNEMSEKDLDDVLHCACRAGNEELFKSLLNLKRLKLDELNRESLDSSEFNFHADAEYKSLVKLISVKKIAFDELTILRSAAIGGNPNIVKLLLDLGWKVDAENFKGNGALYYAAYHGKTEIVKLLLDCGAKDKGEAFVGATSGWQLNLIKSLVNDYGLSVNLKNSQNRSALDIAAQTGRVKLVKCLLDCGADNTISSANLFFIPDLSVGYFKSYDYRVAELLLDSGALVGATDEKKLEILKMAISRKDKETLQLLFDYQLNVVNWDAVGKALEKDVSAWSRKIKLKIVTRHIVKMISQNLHVPEDNLRVINNDDKLREFKKKCELEIEQMKNEVLENSTVSLYDILTSTDLNQLLAFAQNTSILKAVSCWKCKVNFPIYRCVLNNQLRRGVWRKQLLTSVQGFFKAVAKAEGNEDLPILPVLCAAEIFSYLSNKDFKVLMRVCNIDLANYDICNVTIDD